MVINLVVNSTRRIRYCFAESGQWLDEDRPLSFQPRPTIEEVDLFLSEQSDIPSQIGAYSPIAGICAIPPGTSWQTGPDRYYFKSDTRSYAANPTTLDSTLRYAQKLINRLHSGTAVGVDISGGLDSSIVIELLTRWNIPVALVGMRSDRYEFRTEREVQNYYAQRASNLRLYSGEDVPAFSRLDEVPPHPFPTINSLNFAHAMKKVELCEDMGITTLLNGDAGDRLLSFSPPVLNSFGRAPGNWAYWNLAQSIWIDQYLFQPNGLRYISAFAAGRIPTLILQLRSGLDEDRMKLWARRKLKAYLPDLLTNYAYKAFHDGWIIDGIMAAGAVIRKISEVAFNVVPHAELTPDSMEESAIRFRKLDSQQRQRFLLRLSFVTWLYSNQKYLL